MSIYDYNSARFLDTQLTAQEIEQFERFLIENDYYSSYENNKDTYLIVLKFFKHYDKLDIIYDKKSVYFGVAKFSWAAPQIDNIDWSNIAKELIRNEKIDRECRHAVHRPEAYPIRYVLEIKRLIYDKVVDKTTWDCYSWGDILRGKVENYDRAGTDDKTFESIVK